MPVALFGIDIDADALLNLARDFEIKARSYDMAIARVLNEVGDRAVEQVTEAVAAQTGMDPEDVRRNIRIRRASRDLHRFSINASRALIEGPASRPMRGRQMPRRPETYFQANELVQIVTMEDEKVCVVCQDAREDGPYTIEEARAMLPIHPNCRCVVQTFRNRRTLPVEFRRDEEVQTSRMSFQQLIHLIRSEINVVLRAKT